MPIFMPPHHLLHHQCCLCLHWKLDNLECSQTSSSSELSWISTVVTTMLSSSVSSLGCLSTTNEMRWSHFQKWKCKSVSPVVESYVYQNYDLYKDKGKSLNKYCSPSLLTTISFTTNYILIVGWNSILKITCESNFLNLEYNWQNNCMATVTPAGIFAEQ